jgi:hypothetical protein
MTELALKLQGDEIFKLGLEASFPPSFELINIIEPLTVKLLIVSVRVFTVGSVLFPLVIVVEPMVRV